MEDSDIEGMSHFLDSLKWDASGLVAVVVQVSSRAYLPLQRAVMTVNDAPLLIPCMRHAACRYGRHPHASICRQESCQ